MARDIEEFLRRAAERRKKQLKQKQGGQAPAPQPQQPQQTPRRTQKPQRLVISDDEIEVVRKKKKQHDLREESVAQHVRRHMDSSSITEHASHLAEDLEQTDERLVARLSKTFDHDLGSLEGKQPLDQIAPVVTSQKISPLANDLVEMLKSPKTMRQAIIIAEVLSRPNFD